MKSGKKNKSIETVEDFDGWYKYNKENLKAVGIASREGARIILEDRGLVRRHFGRVQPY